MVDPEAVLEPGALPVLGAVSFLERLASLPALLIGSDVQSVIDTLRDACKAVNLFTYSLENEEWQTFEMLRAKQPSVEAFTKTAPTVTQLEKLLVHAQDWREAETVVRKLIQLLDKLARLKNADLSRSQQSYLSYNGQFKLAGSALVPSSINVLRNFYESDALRNLPVSCRG